MPFKSKSLYTVALLNLASSCGSAFSFAPRPQHCLARPIHEVRGRLSTTPQSSRRLEKTRTHAHAATYELTRSLFLRALGATYFTAFLISKNQNKPLIGDRGLTPARHVLDKTEHLPLGKRPISLFYGVKNRAKLDPWLDAVAITGMTFAAVPLFVPQCTTLPVMAALWLLYHSLVSVGGPFFGFMWESQLLETGFLGMCAVPIFAGAAMPPVWFSLLANRWLLWRLMLGAGLIKLRGDRCWRCWNSNQPSCLEYFFETQPVPSPLARHLHFMPKWFHRGSTYTNHAVELVLIWLVLLPPVTQSLAFLGGIAGLIQVLFQCTLIAFGNLSFLNVLTIVPAIWCFNDAQLAPVFGFLSNPGSGGLAAVNAPVAQGWAAQAPYVLLAALLAKLSGRALHNLFLAKKQQMNSTFGSVWRLVNSYGAFGVVNEERTEIVISGAMSYDVPEQEWREYQFAVKPGDTRRPLPFIVPYHHRLDWCVWLAALQASRSGVGPTWVLPLLQRLATNDPGVAGLLAKGGNPFQDGAPPAVLKVERYKYAFVQPGGSSSGEVWRRERLGYYFPRQPVFTAKMLEEYAPCNNEQ